MRMNGGLNRYAMYTPCLTLMIVRNCRGESGPSLQLFFYICFFKERFNIIDDESEPSTLLWSTLD